MVSPLVAPGAAQASAGPRRNARGLAAYPLCGPGDPGPAPRSRHAASLRGPGVNSPFTTTGNGTTHCVLAAQGTPCREMPDISANADEWTPYAEFCTGSASTPESICATFSGSQPAPGWFGIGGTSLSTPLWSAIIADRDSYQRSSQREHQPAAVPAVPRPSETVLPRHHRGRPEAAGRDQQRPVPDHARLRRGHRDRHAEDGGADHVRLASRAAGRRAEHQPGGPCLCPGLSTLTSR